MVMIRSTPVIAALQEEIRRHEGNIPRAKSEVTSTGCEPLNDLFPHQGVREGSLVEWLDAANYGNAALLSLCVGRSIVDEKQALIVIDPSRTIYPMALATLGFHLEQVIFIHPANEHEALWACEESLRCPGVRLVWAQLPQVNSQSFRRLQLAAESARSIGFLNRSASARHHPSWADARLLVHPSSAPVLSPCFRVQVTYSHGKPRRSAIHLMFDAIAGTIHEVPHHLSEIPLPLVS